MKNQGPKKNLMTILKTSSMIFNQVNKILSQIIQKTYNQSILSNRLKKVTKIIQTLKIRFNNQLIPTKNQYLSQQNLHQKIYKQSKTFGANQFINIQETKIRNCLFYQKMKKRENNKTIIKKILVHLLKLQSKRKVIKRIQNKRCCFKEQEPVSQSLLPPFWILKAAFKIFLKRLLLNKKLINYK